MDEEAAFWRAIVTAPLDRLPRLVYCDWLDERTDPRAAGMRVLAEYDRWPWLWQRGYFWSVDTVTGNEYREADWKRNHSCDRSELPEAWLMIMEDDDEEDIDFDTLREAMDVAARAWSDLSPTAQRHCLTELRLIRGHAALTT